MNPPLSPLSSLFSVISFPHALPSPSFLCDVFSSRSFSSHCPLKHAGQIPQFQVWDQQQPTKSSDRYSTLSWEKWDHFCITLSPLPLWPLVYLHTHTHTHTGSQNLWLLANLTEPITVRNRGSLDRTFGSFQGSNNVSLSNLFSFARPSIRASPNFTKLLNTAVENDYTNHLWDQDVTLVVYLVNLTDTVQYKVREQVPQPGSQAPPALECGQCNHGSRESLTKITSVWSKCCKIEICQLYRESPRFIIVYCSTQ